MGRPLTGNAKHFQMGFPLCTPSACPAPLRHRLRGKAPCACAVPPIFAALPGTKHRAPALSPRSLQLCLARDVALTRCVAALAPATACPAPLLQCLYMPCLTAQCLEICRAHAHAALTWCSGACPSAPMPCHTPGAIHCSQACT